MERSAQDVAQWLESLELLGITTQAEAASALGVTRKTLRGMLADGAPRKIALAMDGLSAQLERDLGRRAPGLSATARVELVEWAHQVKRELERMDTTEVREWRSWRPDSTLPWFVERTFMRSWSSAPEPVREHIGEDHTHHDRVLLAGAIAVAAKVRVERGVELAVDQGHGLGTALCEAGVREALVERMLRSSPGEPIGRTYWYEVARRVEVLRLDEWLEMATAVLEADNAARGRVALAFYEGLATA